MRHIAKLVSCMIIFLIFVVGCSNTDSNINKNIEEIALNEANNIVSKEGYSLKSDDLSESDILIGDSEVFKLIKEACINGGYSEKNLNSLTENRKVVGYELREKSKKNTLVMLCLIIDQEKVVGAYLDYSGYTPSITAVDFKDNLK